jgi:hypothetical protein
VTPIRLLIVVGAIAAAFAAIAPVSHARTPCVDRILDEWVHPSKPIATTHALKCYDLALTEAPEDVLLYTNFETDVRSAKQAAIRRDRAPAQQTAAPPPAAPVESVPPGEPLEELPIEELVIEPEQPPVEEVEGTAVDPLAVEEVAPVEDVVPLDEPVPVEPVQSEVVAAPVIDVLRDIGPDDASSVPVPLIVLTIVCGLLAIIGAMLLAARHVQSRRLAEAPPLPPRRRALGDDDPAI